jgi:hypothetical protein
MTCAVIGTPVAVTPVTVGPPVAVEWLIAGPPVTMQGGNVGSAALWTGEGPPPTPLIGASVGDEYIDVLTGNLYRLDPGA